MQFRSEEIALTVTLSPAVIEWFKQHRQTSWKHPEAGGQLFGLVNNNLWIVEACTGPRPTDIRASFRYCPDVSVENQEIMQMYNRGLHFLGDWHTHNQKQPKPSQQDIMSTLRCYYKSITELPGFLMIVVGKTYPDIPCSPSFVNDRIEYLKYLQSEDSLKG